MSEKNKKVVEDQPSAEQVVEENAIENDNKQTETEELPNEDASPDEPQDLASKGSDQITNLAKQLEELKDKYLRKIAEFDNYKRRTMKEKLDMMKTAAQDTMSALLPVLDDFDRAKKNAEDESSTETFSEGVSLVYTKLYSMLKQKGLQPMETTGEAFDPELHEALTEIPAPSEDLKGKIVDTIEKGYFLNDKIIRHAKVVVGK